VRQWRIDDVKEIVNRPNVHNETDRVVTSVILVDQLFQVIVSDRSWARIIMAHSEADPVERELAD
jgi:hypothetical protein